jgi:hypothetical protein
VDVSTLFANYNVISMTEMNLSANQPIDQVHRLKWKVQGEEDLKNEATVSKDFVVQLNPMEIKTFLLRLQPTQ